MRKLKLMATPIAEEHGVCSGIAYWLGIPTGLVRSAFLLGLFASGFSFIIYFILSYTLRTWDEVPTDFEEITGGW